MLDTLKLIEVKSELGAGTRGASLGPDAIKLAASTLKNPFLNNLKTEIIVDKSNELHKSPSSKHALYIKGIIRMYEKIARSVYKTINANQMPIVLSGDHSNAGGTIAGIKMAYPNKRLGVVWIDAHADLHSPYTSPSGNMHGMPLATALAYDFIGNPKNKLKDATIKHWEHLKNLGGIMPKILPQDLVLVGLRDFEKPENDFIKENRVKCVSVDEVRQHANKKEPISNKILQHLAKCDLIYVSFDVDALDKPLVKGTGTPVNNGLYWSETQSLIQNLLKDERLISFETTEVNPLLDAENKTAISVLPLLENALSVLQSNINSRQKN